MLDRICIGLLCLLLVLTIVNYSIPLTVRIILFIIFLSCILLMLSIHNRKPENFSEYDYNYDQENPNALVTGENIAGTVYASYPGKTGGLGWVL